MDRYINRINRWRVGCVTYTLKTSNDDDDDDDDDDDGRVVGA